MLGLALLALQLDFMVLEVFANLNGFVTLQSKDPRQGAGHLPAGGCCGKAKPPLSLSITCERSGHRQSSVSMWDVLASSHRAGSTSPLAAAGHMSALKMFSATQDFGVSDSPAVTWEGQRKQVLTQE